METKNKEIDVIIFEDSESKGGSEDHITIEVNWAPGEGHWRSNTRVSDKMRDMGVSKAEIGHLMDGYTKSMRAFEKNGWELDFVTKLTYAEREIGIRVTPAA
jgi:hypothetical protein